jgi:hypothetical protein
VAKPHSRYGPWPTNIFAGSRAVTATGALLTRPAPVLALPVAAAALELWPPAPASADPANKDNSSTSPKRAIMIILLQFCALGPLPVEMGAQASKSNSSGASNSTLFAAMRSAHHWYRINLLTDPAPFEHLQHRGNRLYSDVFQARLLRPRFLRHCMVKMSRMRLALAAR